MSAADAARPSHGQTASGATRALETTTVDFNEKSITVIEGEEAEEGKYDGLYATVNDEVGYSIQIGYGELEYSYEGDDIFKYFDTSTGDFTLKKGSFGTATVTAKYKGNNAYAPSEASYIVTYREYRGILTFSATQVDVCYGDEASFEAPTLMCRGEDGEEHGFYVHYYTSSDKSVATVDDDGNVTLLKPGTTTIGVEVYDYDSDHTMTASYTLHYRIRPELVRDNLPDFDGTLKCVVNPYEWVEGAIYFPYVDGQLVSDLLNTVSVESQNPSVAQVRREDGRLLVLGEGTTTITFTYAGNDTYEPVSTSYTVVATDPTVQATFRFSNPARYGYGVSDSESHAGDIGENATIVERGHIELVCPTKTGETPNRFYSPSGSGSDAVLELYAGTVVSVSPGEKARISSVTARGTKDGEAVEITDWTISANKSVATVEINDDVCLSSLTIDYHLIPVDIDENDKKGYDFLKNSYNNMPVNASLKRTLVGGKWNTLSLPFDTEIEGSPLEGAIVKKFGSVKDNVIYFVDADRIEAGHPYLVKPTGTIENPTFNSVVIKPIGELKVYDGESPYFFYGNVTPCELNWVYSAVYGGKFYGVTSEGKLARINNDTTVKGLRAIFLFKNQATTATLSLDGGATGIGGIEAAKTQDGKVYNLQGQCVGDSLDGLPGGIYIVGGKKVIK